MATICDACQVRIDEDWTGAAIEVKNHNGVDIDVAGDFCTHCTGDIADAIRSVIGANNRSDSINE